MCLGDNNTSLGDNQIQGIHHRDHLAQGARTEIDRTLGLLLQKKDITGHPRNTPQDQDRDLSTENIDLIEDHTQNHQSLKKDTENTDLIERGKRVTTTENTRPLSHLTESTTGNLDLEIKIKDPHLAIENTVEDIIVQMTTLQATVQHHHHQSVEDAVILRHLQRVKREHQWQS